MPIPKPPDGWSHIRAWLLDLADADRRYVRGWIVRWISTAGKLTGLAAYEQHAELVAKSLRPPPKDESS